MAETDAPPTKKVLLDDSRLIAVLQAEEWAEATRMVQNETFRFRTNHSPLAQACRLGAPYECVKAILDADPGKLRHVIDARGTPLHEATICDTVGPRVIQALLDADEALGTSSTRACLLQDVDGFTPMHLLIRRRFQSHILGLVSQSGSTFMEILEMMARSCPDSVTVPDRGEYEEAPIVYAVKADVYSPTIPVSATPYGEDENLMATLEREIFHMIQCMIRFCPRAATCVFEGYRGRYTALHSAVFHGRHPSTIELLLEAEGSHGRTSTSAAALLANTQGEMPLHFCAMRGEQPHAMSLLAEASPMAIVKRDVSGLTPLHWMWIRFVSTMLTLEEDGRGTTTTMELRMMAPGTESASRRYCDFTNLEQGDFNSDLRLIKRMDPPVDFLRMRHIPTDVLADEQTDLWAKRTVQVLSAVQERFRARNRSENEQVSVWNRREVVCALFWTKVVSLITTAPLEGRTRPVPDEPLIVHKAFANPSCPPGVTFVVASLFPEECLVQDSSGRLPVHYAACRPWNAWDWRRDDSGQSEPHATKLLFLESLRSLHLAVDLSGPNCMEVEDKQGRLVLHHAIDSFLSACVTLLVPPSDNASSSIITLLKRLIQLNPRSLQKIDGVTKLPPFLQATVAAAGVKQRKQEELSISIIYELLIEDPSLLAQSGRSSS